MGEVNLDMRPLNNEFGAEFPETDLSRDLDKSVVDRIRDTLWNRLLLVFRNQKLDADRLLALARLFGQPAKCVDLRFALDGYPEIALVGNTDQSASSRTMQVNGQVEWHYDYAHTPTPALVSLLYGVEVPRQGGDTLFADTRSAYAALTGAEQQQARAATATYSNARLNDLLDAQDLTRIAADAPGMAPVTRHLVEEHPVTGRPALLLAPELMVGLDGASIGDVSAWVERATTPEFLYRHKWQPNDLVVCDNRSTVHTATPIEDRTAQRLLYRIAVLPATSSATTS